MDLDAVRKKLQGLQTKTTRQNNLWKPEPGGQVIRIVPNKASTDYPFHELYFHYGLMGKNYLSPQTNGKADPLVEFAEKLKSTGSKEDYQLSRQITPKMRVYVPVIVRGQESEGVKFWGFGKQVYTELLGFISDPDYGDITDPGAGRDISVEFTPSEGAGSYPKTTIRVKPNQTPVSDDKAVLDSISNQPAIADIFKEPEYEELKETLESWLEGGSEGEAENAKPPAVDAIANNTNTEKSDNVGQAFDKLFKD